MTVLVVTKYNHVLYAFYQKLLNKGKWKKVALVASIRKLLIILNSMSKNHAPCDTKL